MKKYLFILLALLCASPMLAQTEIEDNDSILTLPSDSLPWPQNIQARIDSLLEHPMFQQSTVGLMVYDLTTDSVIYQHNHQQRLRPASTMKLITAIAAIDRLGSSYQLCTSLYYNGDIYDHTLWGDLYCKGSMDPLFNKDDLYAFVESLKSMGVDTIRGRIMADCSMKDTLHWGEGWCWDDDNPTLSALLVSKKDDFQNRFISELIEGGIELPDITLSSGRTPEAAYRLCTRTHTIGQVLERMMKESDNLHAESAFYHLAASTGQHPATAKQASKLIEELIQRLGLNPRNYRIADGSGLSLYDYLSAELEVQMLRYAWQNKEIYYTLLPSLPIAGEDGTLEKRMRSAFTSGNVRAKTGTVTGISSLAGYCTAANGHDLCFCIINQGILRTSNGRRFQDRVCTALCQP